MNIIYNKNKIWKYHAYYYSKALLHFKRVRKKYTTADSCESVTLSADNAAKYTVAKKLFYMK